MLSARERLEHNQPRGDTAAVHGGDCAPGMLYCIRQTVLTIITIDDGDHDDQASCRMHSQPRGNTTATHGGGDRAGKYVTSRLTTTT